MKLTGQFVEIPEVIPEGKIFVMGDNRDDSKDSRMIGTIPFKDVKGTTELILFPFNRFGKVKKYN